MPATNAVADDATASRADSRGGHDPRVDAYIADAPAYARPILSQLRHVVHAACPDVAEDVKWRMPFFVYRGKNLCHMAAFKAHCAFGFWRGKEIPGLPTLGADGQPTAAMGNIGRIGSLDDLPPRRTLTSWIKAAVRLADSDAKPPRTTAKRAPPPLPDDFARALAAGDGARAAFDAMSPSCRREYIEWIVDAKREATRASRIATAVEWIAEGRARNWKYERC